MQKVALSVVFFFFSCYIAEKTVYLRRVFGHYSGKESATIHIIYRNNKLWKSEDESFRSCHRLRV